MKLDRVEPGDVVRCAIKGRTGIYGEVTEVKDGIVYFRPLCPATGWLHASAREVVGHWRKAGRRGGDDSTLPVPRGATLLAWGSHMTGRRAPRDTSADLSHAPTGGLTSSADGASLCGYAAGVVDARHVAARAETAPPYDLAVCVVSRR